MSKYSYESYKAEYERAVAQQKKKGLPFAEEMYSKKQFEAMSTALANDLQEQIKAGTRKGMGNIYKTLVSEQRWEISKKQAMAQHMAMYNLNNKIKVSVDELRAGFIKPNHVNEVNAFWDATDNTYHRAKEAYLKEGYSEKEASEHARKMVSREYFGSI